MRTAIVLTILFATGAAHAVAQEVPRQLTLDDAIRIALQRNPAHRRVANDEDVTAVAERAAWSQFLPNVSASAGTGTTRSRPVTGQDDFGQPIALRDPIDYRTSSANQTISASLTLFDGLSRVGSLRAARAESRAAAARIAASRNALIADVSRRYYTRSEERRVGKEWNAWCATLA